jgi:hypothetical protein
VVEEQQDLGAVCVSGVSKCAFVRLIDSGRLIVLCSKALDVDARRSVLRRRFESMREQVRFRFLICSGPPSRSRLRLTLP